MDFYRYLFRVPDSQQDEWIMSLRGRRRHYIGPWPDRVLQMLRYRVGTRSACGSWVDYARHLRIEAAGKLISVPPCARCIAHQNRLADLYHEDKIPL